MEETTFFQYEDVRVTNARFVVGSQTFALSNITSVKSYEQSPNRLWPIAFVIVGVIVVMGGAAPVGLLFLAIGGVWWYLQKSLFQVRLATAGGETTALESEQRDYIQKIVEALNAAIVARG
jgi:hypothetical protein